MGSDKISHIKIAMAFIAIAILTVIFLCDETYDAKAETSQNLSAEPAQESTEANAMNVKNRILEILDAQSNLIKGSDVFTVSIDNTDFYVIGQKDDEVLLFSKESIKESSFGKSVVWKTSKAREYLNDADSDGYLSDRPILKSMLVETTISTANTYNRSGGYAKTCDSVFLLSEADFFRTANTIDTFEDEEYTIGRNFRISDNVRNNGTSYWLRSPKSRKNISAAILTDGTLGGNFCEDECMIRPAMWVNIC